MATLPQLLEDDIRRCDEILRTFIARTDATTALRDPNDGIFTCPESGLRYHETVPGTLRCLNLDEEAPLPPELAAGLKPYRDFHRPA